MAFYKIAFAPGAGRQAAAFSAAHTNTGDYAPGGLAPAELPADLEVLVHAGTDALQFLPAHLPAHAAVLLVPDFCHRGWVTAWGVHECDGC
jgi:hypothetical protein